MRGPIPRLKTGPRLLSHVCLHETLTAKARPAARLPSAERPTVPSRESSRVHRSWEPEVPSPPTSQTAAAQPAALAAPWGGFETTRVLYVLLRPPEALSSPVITLSGASAGPAPTDFCKHQLLPLGTLAQACLTP